MIFESHNRRRSRLAKEASLLWMLIKSSRVLLTIAAAGSGIAAYYAFSLEGLCSIMASLEARSLAFVGLPSVNCGQYLIVGDHVFQIVPDCLYLDWLLLSLPFLAYRQQKLANVIIIAIAIATVPLLNFLRMFMSIYLNVAKNWDWYWSHDLPDYFTWYGTFAMVVTIWFVHQRAAMKQKLEKERTAADSA